MSNVVIASNDTVCQSAKEWFKRKLQYVEGPPVDVLKDGEQLVVIAHNTDLRDATAFQSFISKYDFPMAAKFTVFLIVCSAASMDFMTELKTPAERVADFFQRTVRASDTVVVGEWNESGAVFTGTYRDIKPGDGVTDRLANLSLNQH
jgi:hypothetical protein